MYKRLSTIMQLFERYDLLLQNETNQDIIDIMDALHCMMNICLFRPRRRELIEKYGRILETTYTIPISNRLIIDLDETYALLQKVYCDLQE